MKWIDELTGGETRLAKAFDRVINVLIVASLMQFAIETLPEANGFMNWFVWSERVIVTIFTVEYVLRVMSRGLTYVLSFYGLIDFLAIIPFYLSLGALDLRSVRILRLMRLLRIAKLQRYGTAWKRLRLAFSDIKDELAVYVGLTVILIYLASVGIYYCEHDAQPEVFRSVFHSMWWAVSTLTTVGYGDVFPVTVAGKLFTFVILILGLGVVSVPSALIASALMKQPEERSASTRND